MPHDPLELVTGSAEPLEGPERDAANQLLVRAREVYLPRGAGAPVAIRYTFTVSSGGTTEHDGKWEVEEVSSPPANSSSATAKWIAMPAKLCPNES